MSEIAADADLSIWVADFASLDAVGKLNMLGGGVVLIGFDALQGVTTRFTVLGRVRVPAKYTPVDVPIELTLLDELGDVVTVGAPAPQPIRVAQVAKLEKPNVVGMPTLPAELPAQHFIALDIQGLPLQPGRVYSWSLRVDGDEDHAKRYEFFVPGATGPRIVPG